MAGLFTLTDEQWAVLKPLLPPHPRRPGRPWADDRAILDAILWVMCTGSPWRSLPPCYPSYQTCHRRYLQWRRSGLLDHLLRALFLDLRHRGGLDFSRCLAEGRLILSPSSPAAPSSLTCQPSNLPTFQPSSWQLHTALVFLMPLLRAYRPH